MFVSCQTSVDFALSCALNPGLEDDLTQRKECRNATAASSSVYLRINHLRLIYGDKAGGDTVKKRLNPLDRTRFSRLYVVSVGCQSLYFIKCIRYNVKRVV